MTEIWYTNFREQILSYKALHRTDSTRGSVVTAFSGKENRHESQLGLGVHNVKEAGIQMIAKAMPYK